MINIGIRNRVLLLALLPGTLIALVLSGYFTRGQLDLVEQSLNDRGITIARQLAPASEYGFIAGNRELLGQLATSLMSQSDIAGISITDTEQNPLYAVGSLTGERILPSPASEDVYLCGSGETAQLYCAPIVKTVLEVSDFPGADADSAQQQIIGWVYVEMSTSYMNTQRSAIITRALLMTGFLLLMAGLVAVRIGRQISLPIVSLTRVVGKVADGDLELKASSGSAGEIGQLEKGIDSMIASLRIAREEMRSNIESATSQLRQALGELETRNCDLEEQRMKAQAASEAKSRFLANMSHEIRTPLSGMVGVLFMLRQTRPTPEQKEYLENLENSATTLRLLIDDILDLSRIEAGRLIIHEQVFVLRELLSAVSAILAPGAHQKGIEFIVHVNKNVPRYVQGDPLRLRQILTNLIGNAVKFTESGFVRLHVSCSLDTEKYILSTRFAVEDSGIGIAKDKLDYIFESFAQADESTTRRYGGSGLGTTISRELVNLMAGTIQVESEEGRGTRFMFELPLGFVEDDEQELQPYAGRKAILLESHEPCRIAERELLEMLGFDVRAFESTEQFMSELDAEGENYQLLVLAENDRDSSLLGVVHEIRQRYAGRISAKILHLTFFDGYNDSTMSDGLLHKPLSMEHLKAKLDEMMSGLRTDVLEEESVEYTANVLDILVAEDDAINAKVMSYFLQQKGHRVVLAHNGREALELLRRQPFDLVFLDMRMPEMDGLMVARQWRQEEPDEERLPLIAVTANVTREDREACFEAGMDDFISKPVDPLRLTELLERYVQGKAAST